MSKKLLLELKSVSKSYTDNKQKSTILDNINLQFTESEVVALLGASGSGKSTLLNLIGLLDTPDTGDIIIDNVSCSNLNENQKSIMRREKIGFVFQFHHLLVDFNVLENVMLPGLINNQPRVKVKQMAQELLEAVGLKDKENRYINEISGGERQRVAIARALINKPIVILADEPTGNLDPVLSEEICSLILNLSHKYQAVTIIATHDMQIAKQIGKNLIVKNRELTKVVSY